MRWGWAPDGTTWTTASVGTTAALFSLAWSGQLLVAVGQSGATVASPDGVSWTPGAVPGTPQLEGVTWAGDHFVAVGWGATAFRSTDGLSWTPISIPGSVLDSDLYGVAYSGQRTVMVGEDGVIITLAP